MFNSTDHESLVANKGELVKKSLALKLSDVVLILLIDVKMPTIVGILTFMSGIVFMLS